MVLAHFLNTGQWLRCQDYANTGTDPDCLMTNEQLLWRDTRRPLNVEKSWNGFYKYSNTRLQGNNQTELCDCFRRTDFTPGSTYENRYLQRQTPFGLIRLTYLQYFGAAAGISVHRDFPPFRDFHTAKHGDHCHPGECSAQTPRMRLDKSLDDIVAKMEPTHLFVQTGWVEKNIGCLLALFEQKHSGVQAWVMTRPCEQGTSCPYGKPTVVAPLYSANSNVSAHAMHCNVHPQGCNAKVFDRFTSSSGVPQHWYFDNMHVLSILNQVFNHDLIDAICGA